MEESDKRYSIPLIYPNAVLLFFCALINFLKHTNWWIFFFCFVFWMANRYKDVVISSMGSFFLLFISPILNNSSNDRKSLAKYNAIITVLVVFLVSCFQIRLVSMTVSRPIDHNIFGILFILGLSSAISVIEVSFLSWIAAIIIAIFWGIILAWLVKSNWKVISNEDIVLSKEIKKFITVSFEGIMILSIGYICSISMFYIIERIWYYILYFSQ